MSDELNSGSASLSLQALERIETVCLEFEAAWKKGERPRIEDHLGTAQGAERRELFRELLLLDVDYRSRGEEHPSEDEYRARFPQDSQLVSDVFEELSTGAALSETSPYASAPGSRRQTFPCQFGDYELLEVLGEGGMGIVYRARQRTPDRIVALKIIHPDRLAAGGSEKREKAIERFRAETQAAASLEHGHIVPVYEVGQIEDQPFFSMRHIQGRGLEEVLRDGPLDGRDAAALLKPVAQALHYAHGRDIVHRDIKPRNILVDTDGQPHVADFGLAKSFAGAQDLTQTAEAIGTPAYMSPEQAEGPAEVDSRTDVYSLGATLYELLTGRPPFRAATAVQTQRQVVENEPVPPRQLNPAIDRDLETICLKCLEKEPVKRYTTAKEVAEEFTRYQQGRPIQARPITPVTRAWRWCRRNRLVAGLGALAGSLLLVLAIGGPIVAGHQAALRRQALRETGRAERALDEANRQWRRAEADFKLALDAVDRMLTRVSQSLAHVPHATQVQGSLFDDALEFYQDFLEREGQDETLRTETALAYTRVGSIYTMLGAHAKAKDAYDEGIRRLEQLRREFPGHAEYRYYLAVTYDELGKTLRASDLFPAAEEALAEARRLARELHDEDPEDPSSGGLLVLICYDQSVLLQAMGRQQELEETCREAIRIGEAIVDKPLEQSRHYGSYPACMSVGADCRNALSSVYGMLGLVLREKGRLADAEQAYRRCVELMELERAKLEHSPEYRHNLACAYNSLGGLLKDTNRDEEALELYDAAIALSEKNHQDSPLTPVYQSVLGASLHNKATLLHRKHKATEARLLLERAVTHQRNALDREPHNTTSGQFLRNHYLLLAEILLSQRDHAALAALAAEAPGDYDDCEWHVWAVKTLAACAHLARVDSNLSPMAREECADGYLDQARGFLLGAAKHAQTPNECRGVYWALAEHPETALHDADRAVEVTEKAVQTYPDDRLCRSTLGKAFYRAGRFEEAIRQLEKSNELASDSSSANWLYLAMAHWQRGHKEESRTCFDEADRLLKQNPQSSKQMYSLRAEAARLLGIATASAEEENDVEDECDEWPSIDR